MLTRTRGRLLNKVALVRAYRRGSADVAGYPSVVTIETSSRCNLRCPMCIREAGNKREEGDMPLNVFQKVIDDVGRLAELAVLHNAGEPLMNEQITDMVAYAAHRKMHTLLSTNATLLDQDRAMALVRSGLSIIIIALDGASKETYEAIRRGAQYEMVESNIRGLIEAKKRAGRKNPEIVLQFIDLHENRSERDAFRRKWAAHDVRVFIKPSTVMGRSGGRARAGTCDRLWFQSVILSSGEMVPCCNDVAAAHALGDVRRESCRDLWSSDRMRRLRRLSASGAGAPGLCDSCSYDPPYRHSLAADAAHCVLDGRTAAMLLYRFGYRKKSQR